MLAALVAAGGAAATLMPAPARLPAAIPTAAAALTSALMAADLEQIGPTGRPQQGHIARIQLSHRQ
ncbi:hypothetical protein [Streptomyces sp. NPDC087300]|uniref:hypothetical protein n=1 Tax=Streptomyces sp. NPDC087300 TaxID=3365780 RepID=UPI003809FF2B